MKYGDRVTLVQKSTDGSLRRLNAIVLATARHIPLTHDRKPVQDAGPSDHVDLAFPVPTLVPDGAVLKSRDTGEIFRIAYDVAPYADGAWIGYETVADADADALKAELAAERAKCGAALADLAECEHQLAKANDKLEIAGRSKSDAAPSAADLDAHAAEEAARAATAHGGES